MKPPEDRRPNSSSSGCAVRREDRRAGERAGRLTGLANRARRGRSSPAMATIAERNDGVATTARGHPAGLAILSATELAERFSYYGMTALLALYMVKQLLLPGHAEHVIGLTALRHLFEFRGPMPDQAFASLIYGWYGGLVYFTPILGGWIADRFIGTKRAVIARRAADGGRPPCHVLRRRPSSLRLLLLITGSGFLKGNISAQVGLLYPPTSESLRERGFAIFSTGINIGAVLGPLATGHGGGKSMAGMRASRSRPVLMLVALAVYLAGQRHLPDKRPKRAERAAQPALTAEETTPGLGDHPAHRAQRPGGDFLHDDLERRHRLDRREGKPRPVPASWFNSVDSFASVVIAPVLVALWAMAGSAGRRAGRPHQAGHRFCHHRRCPRCSSRPAACLRETARCRSLWALLGYFGMGVGFMWYWPVLLATISKSAPAKVNSTLMGAAFLCLFVGTVLMGWVGSFYEDMSNAGVLDARRCDRVRGDSAWHRLSASPLAKALGLCTP